MYHDASLVKCWFHGRYFNPYKCTESVALAFDHLYEELGHDIFTNIFQVILTDRGTKVSNPTWQEKLVFCYRLNATLKQMLHLVCP